MPATYALSFSNANKTYVDIPDSTVLHLGGPFTLEAWIYQTGAQSNGYRIVDKETAGVNDGFNFDTYDPSAAHNGHRLRLCAGNSCISANTTYALNQWHHVAVVVSGTTATLYLDGNDDGSGAVGTVLTNTLHLYIGASHLGCGGGCGTAEYFNGTIDEVRIWNVARTQRQLQQSMNSILTGTEAGLVGYWRFDEGSGATTADASGNGGTGTLVNGPTWVTSGAPLGPPPSQYVPSGGYAGAALTFGGPYNSYVDVPDNNTLHLGSVFTIEAWIYQTQAPGDGYRIVDKETGAGGDGFNFDTYNSNGTGRVLRLCGNAQCVSANTAYSLNQWHHAAVVVSGTVATFYLDGQQDGGGAVGAIQTNTLDLYIGGPHGNCPVACQVDQYFNGSIDDVRIWNVARTPQQIQQAMHTIVAGTDAGLVADWRFDEGYGATAGDASGHGNPGALLNWPTWVNSTAPITSAEPTLPPVDGTIPWHAHHGVRMADGLGAQIDLADGHVDVSASALQLPGRGPDLALDQTWDSVAAQSGVTTTGGLGWVSSLSPSIGGAITGTLTFTDDTGASWPLTYTGSFSATGPYTAYSPPPGMPWQLAVATTPSVAYTLTNFLTGATMSFDSQGRYSGTADAYGNKNTLPITTNPGPDSITNVGGRSIQVSYGSNGLLSEARSPLWVSGGNGQAGSQHVTYGYMPGTTQLQTITTQAGTGQDLTTTFGYSGTQLVTVTVPSGRQWTITYDASDRVSSVTSPQSGTVTTAPGYTPAYTTAFTYTFGQTMMVEGFGSPHPVTTTYALDSQGDPTTITDGAGHQTSATYDADHDVTSRTDANGNLTQYGYQYVGPPGASPALTTTGLLTQTISPPVAAYTTTNSLAPVVTTYAYNPGTDDLAEVDLPQGARTFYGYDGAHHAVITTTQLLKDTPGFGCPQVAQRGPTVSAARAAALPQACAQSYTWRATVTQRNGVGQVVARVDARGVDAPQTTSPTPPTAALNASAALYTSSYGYDAQGDLTSASTPPITTTAGADAPVTTVYTPDADGNVTSVQSPNGNVTSYVYDHLGRVTMTTAPPVALSDGKTGSPSTSVTYDPDGNLATTSDALGDTVARSYDPLGRMTTLTNALGRTALMTYTATQLVATQDYSGSVSQQAYDAADRLTSATDALGISSSYGYDNVGNTTAITTPLDFAGVSTTSAITRTYDALNRLSTEGVLGLGGASPTTTQASSTSYDQDGNVSLRVQTGGGGVTYSQYDLADRFEGTTIFTSTAALAALAGDSITLDNADYPTMSYDFNGRDHGFAFDGAGRTTLATDCLSCAGTTPITTTDTYDPDGNATALTRTVGAATPVATGAVYNADDWLTRRDDGAGPTTFGYDQAGRWRTQSLLGSVTRGQLARTVNANGVMTGLTDVVTDTSPAGTSSSTSLFTSTLNDLPLTTTLNTGPTGLTEWRSYDADSRLTGLHVTGPLTASPLLAYDESVGHDAQGHTTGITATGAIGPSDNVRRTARYTAQGFLQVGTLNGTFGGNWSYDGAGNVHTGFNQGGVTSYTYVGDAGVTAPRGALPNEVLTAALDPGTGNGLQAYQYTYDASGYATRIATNGVTKTLSYDGQGRLIGVATQGSAADNTVAIAYNARGLRARYTVTRTGQGQPAFDERFLYRDTAQVGQVVVSGTQVTTPFTETFLYRQDGTPLELLNQPQGQRTARYWYVVDGRGDVLAVVDASGTKVADYSYDLWGAPQGPYGSPLNAIDETNGLHQPLRYRGYWYDGWDDSLGSAPGQGWNGASASGGQSWSPTAMPLPWYALGVRSYDPALERFLQPDPASQTGLPDYVYAHDDPLDYADPSGLDAVPLNCGNTTTGTAAALGCEAQASAASQQAQTNAALWAPANFLLLDPLRNTFGPGKSLFDRGLGAFSLLPFAGVVGHGLGLAADLGRGLEAARGLETVATAVDGTTALADAGQVLQTGAAIDASGQRTNIVYRGLAQGEDPALGLRARAPGIGNSIASHVAGARQTQWISTTRDLTVARDVFGANGAVEIDLSKVPGTIVDASDGIPGLPRYAMLSNWARKYQEVLVQDYIPPEAIGPLP